MVKSFELWWKVSVAMVSRCSSLTGRKVGEVGVVSHLYFVISLFSCGQRI